MVSTCEIVEQNDSLLIRESLMVGKLPWSSKESMINFYKNEKEMPHFSKFNLNIPIDSPIFVEEIAKAEIEAMKHLILKEDERLLSPVLTLINKSDYRELHNHLTILFCKSSERKLLLNNKKLKKFVCDLNYIMAHFGLKGLGYYDKNVRISKRAVAIVKNLGEPTPRKIVEYKCLNLRLLEKINKMIKKSNEPTIKEKTADFLKKKVSDIIKSCEKSDKNRIEISESNYKVPNYIQKIPEKLCVKIKKEMEKIKNPITLNLEPDYKLREECVKSLKKITEYEAKMSYKNALMKECEEKKIEIFKKIKVAQFNIQNYDNLPKEFKENLIKEKIKNCEFDNFEPKTEKDFLSFTNFGMFEMIDLGSGKLSADFYKLYNERVKMEERELEKYKKMNERNIERYKHEFRENWVEVCKGLKMTFAKVHALKKAFNFVNIEKPKILNRNWDIVRTEYFKNEAIKRAMLDMEFRRKNFNSFKLNKCRKQRARSIIDSFFGTVSICSKKRKMYGSFDTVDDKGINFIMRGLDMILMQELNCNSFDLPKIEIEEYFEDIPFRRFTKKGVEIRDIEVFERLGTACKRKVENFIDKVGKRRDIKFGEMSHSEENSLINFFLEKIKTKEENVTKVRSEIEDVEKDIEKIQLKILSEIKEEKKLNDYDLLPMEEKIFRMLENKNISDSSKIEKEIKIEKKLQKEDFEKNLKEDEIDILNKNIERVFKMREGIYVNKKALDERINKEISELELLGSEINSYRKLMYEEEISKMNKYNENIDYLRSVYRDNEYTKDLIKMKFLEYQTLSRNVNIKVSCEMEDRMFKICLDKFLSKKGERDYESKVRREKRALEEVDKGIEIRRQKLKEKEDLEINKIIKEYIKKEKERLKKKTKGLKVPDKKVLSDLDNLIKSKKSIISEKLLKISELESNLKSFKLQKSNIMKIGYNKEIKECRRKKITKDIEMTRFKNNLFKEMTVGEIVEEISPRIDIEKIVKENIGLTFKLMIKAAHKDKIDEIYKKIDKERYEREKIPYK